MGEWASAAAARETKINKSKINKERSNQEQDQQQRKTKNESTQETKINKSKIEYGTQLHQLLPPLSVQHASGSRPSSATLLTSVRMNQFVVSSAAADSPRIATPKLNRVAELSRGQPLR